MPSEIQQLVQRCLGGDQTAMVALVDRYRNQVFGLCFRMLGQRQDAEDVTQETFIRVLKSLANWDADRAFEPWLLAIAGNRCRTALAARSRRPAAAALSEEQFMDHRPDYQAAENLAEEVQLALTSIRPEHREAFILFHEQELNYEEIAAAMQRPLNTIKTWIRRARNELVQRLREREVVAGTRC